MDILEVGSSARRVSIPCQPVTYDETLMLWKFEGEGQEYTSLSDCLPAIEYKIQTVADPFCMYAFL
jgi:hypothetical protein